MLPTPSLVIRGARQVITMRGADLPRTGSRMKELGVVSDASLVLEEGLISEIGSSRRISNLASIRYMEDYDAAGCIVIPGLVDPVVDLLGRRPSLPAIMRRAARLIEHGTTTAGAISRQRKPLHCDDTLVEMGLEVSWDVSLTAEVITPLQSLRERVEVEPAREAIESGRIVALASGYNSQTSPGCSMLAALSIACLCGDFTIEETMSAATTNAAHAIGKGSVAGSIEPGRPADVLILNVPDYAAIPYHLGENIIRCVIKKGNIVYKAAGLEGWMLG